MRVISNRSGQRQPLLGALLSLAGLAAALALVLSTLMASPVIMDTGRGSVAISAGAADGSPLVLAGQRDR